MAHMTRTVKNIEAPRPLKSQSRSSLKNNYMLIEELIQLIENVASTLQTGVNNPEAMSTLVHNLKIHGPQLESVSKGTLDRAFVVFRNASQDERLNIMTRLNLLELIELRAKGWEDTGLNSYYKAKQATQQVQTIDLTGSPPTGYDCTSPSFGSTTTASILAGVGTPQQQIMLLLPGEVIRNSGKFSKPTKIPGKTYCKDEVVIKNADSGKVMGIKGRRVHMIEELSETIISFQRVSPGAKERLVQITGPAEEKINYAKQLIEDTIRRNASPVRLEPSATGEGSCSSLASSNSDEVTPRASTGGGASNITNRLSFNSAQNFMTVQTALAQQQAAAAAAAANSNLMSNPLLAAKSQRQNPQILLHSYSTNDASLGEYKFTVNVGQHMIKITGDCCELVRVAKLVLDDYFSSAEFLASVEAGMGFDNSLASPVTTPTGMMLPHHGIGLAADSGIGLNYMSTKATLEEANEGEDDVFADANGGNGLSRSRRSHFSRRDMDAEVQSFQESSQKDNITKNKSARIVHEYEHLLFYAKSPHAWALPIEWSKICEKFPSIVRNKDLQDESQRFDGMKYLESVKAAGKRNIAAADDSNVEGDTQDNE